MQYANTGLLLGLRQQGLPRPGRQARGDAATRRSAAKLFGDMQKKLAEDAVNAYIFNPAQVAVAKKGLKGLWASSPIFANDIAAVSWQ